MGWDAEQRDQTEHPDLAEAAGKLHRCQLHCWENIHPFTTPVFHPLQPEWGNMLGFCICNWGRTDGGGTVGSNTAIKIIYTACNFPSCGDRAGPASARVPTQAAGKVGTGLGFVLLFWWVLRVLLFPFPWDAPCAPLEVI